MHEVIGTSDVFLELMEKTSRLAKINRPILIFGERGSGKELIAERLHFLSERWDQPYIKVNCAALSENLLEAELFGYEQGAFTGAQRSKDGKFTRANGGTIFLDEIANASLLLQEKMLRVIEYGEFEKVGGHKTLEVDVRIVAATNEDLRDKVAKGIFRADLLDRLCFDVLMPPPLRHRKEDILLLAEFFANRFVPHLDKREAIIFSSSFVEQLYQYSWPGNVRELRNAVERSVFHHNSSEPVECLLVDPFASPIPCSRPIEKMQPKAESFGFDYNDELSLTENLRAIEFAVLDRVLHATKYNQTEAAERLQLTYHQLRNYLKKHKLIGKKQGALGKDHKKTGETSAFTPG